MQESIGGTMNSKGIYSREGYLKENYRYFHLRDTAGQERDFHFHDFDKIVLLLEGRVEYLVEDAGYELKPWSVLLVKHHTIHKALIDKSTPYERVIIYLDRKFFERALPGASLMDCFERADENSGHLLYPSPEEREELRQYLENFERAAMDERYGAQTMRDTIIMQLLVSVGRLNAAAPGEKKSFDFKIEQALSFINENLASELSVDVLAEQVYLSRYHFMRLFKAQTGSTVHAYIRQKRLLQAARLIREGSPANKAAADSGFTDYSAFHRAFRECFGISPGQLKK